MSTSVTAFGSVARAPGFADPTGDAQLTYRAILDAMAHPGRRNHLVCPESPPLALGRGLAAVLLTLLDEGTTLHVGPQLGRDSELLAYVTFHTGTRIVLDPAVADFVLTSPETLPALSELLLGSDESPHLSATVLLDARGATGRTTFEARGPGIESTVHLAAPWAPQGFLDAWSRNGALFPRGVDLLVVDDNSVLALPRTTRLTAHPELEA